MNLLNKLERKIGRLAISHLMFYVCGGMLIVFLTDYLLPQVGLGSLLALDMTRVAQGEVWRLITFIFFRWTHLRPGFCSACIFTV
ncbi:MAG: hypothetical protein ACOYJR_08285 [Acutalibacteraceae bacterium]|jgi:membrane associated rhomboid family serine protease